MRRLVLVCAGALVGLSLAVGTVAGGGFWKAPPFSAIGINNVYSIDNSFGEGGPDSTVFRVWMETGSSSEACLVTMGEAFEGVEVQQIYCSSRHVTLEDGEGHWGTLVTLILAAPLSDGSWYSLNVYQEGAKGWGAPILCDLPGCS